MEDQLFDFIAKYLVLTQEEKQAILDLSIFKVFPKGTVLMRQGEVCNGYYFVIKGCLRCYYVQDGDEKTSAFYTELESLAPQATAKGKPSDYYVVCLEDCILTVANPDMEAMIFERFPRFETLCRLLSEELLAKSHASLDDFKHASPEQRYLNLLQTRPDLVQRVPLYHLASFLGIKPESLSRIRKRIGQ